VRVPLARVKEVFQEFYLGTGGSKGLVQNEIWLIRRQVLDRLRAGHKVGVVTGRPRAEAVAALRAAWVEDRFDAVVAREDVGPGRLKPHPAGLLTAMRLAGAYRGVYVGDSVDDMRAARAAGLHALGVIPPGADRERHAEVLGKAGAEAVIEHIDRVEDAVKKLLEG
jgi:phosphoglycolate phosphatase-like HAD superfamily hydrolase